MKNDSIVRFGDYVFRHRDTLPVPFILIAILILIFTKPTFETLHAKIILYTIGGIVVILGEAIRVWAVGYSGGTTRSKKLIADRLVKEGPYSIIRNPLYAGNFLIAFGFSLTANAVFVIPIVVLYFIIEYYPIVIREESFLLERFGSEYEQYLKEVPRFFPKSLNIKKAHYESSALKGEAWTIFGILFMFVIMIALNVIRARF